MQGFQDNPPTPSYIDVFNLLDDNMVFSYYVPGLVINSAMPSPIGAPDNNPSFSVFWSNRKQKLLFKEHRYGYVGDCVDFVRILFGYKDNTRACMRIFHDFGIKGFKIDSSIMQIESSDHKIIKVPRRLVGNSTIQIKVRAWKQHDLDYWIQFGITKEWLNKGDIYPIEYYFINGMPTKADNYAYAYIERKDGKITYKIYQPYNQYGNKWINNNDSSVWELWELLPLHYSILVITKSRKDALSIMATAGIPATALQAEGTIPKEQVVNELKSRFDNIVLLYDNDFDSKVNYGLEYAKKFSNKFNIPYSIIPDNYKSKDYTDLILNHSISKAREVLLDIIKKLKK